MKEINLNKETQLIDEIVFSNDWRAIRNLYFKICVICGVQPRYSHFCSLMNIREIRSKNILFKDDRVNTAYLNKKFIRFFKAWKRTCFTFTESERAYIRRRNLEPGIRIFYDTIRKI